MKLVSLLIAAAALACSCVTASAKQAVRPQWNYQGSVVCPNGYDFYAQKGLWMARGGYVGGPRYGGGYEGGGYVGVLPPERNRAGSVVCPEGYDFHARSGLCRPQRY